MSLLQKLAEMRDQEPEEVAKALGLDAGADAEDDAVLEALSGLPEKVNELEGELEEQPPASEPVMNALDLDPDTGQRGILTAIGRLQVQSDISPVANALGLDSGAGVDDMVSAIESLKEEDEEGKAAALVANAVEAGKVPPAKKDYLLRLAKTDIEAAREVINSLGGQVDLQGEDIDAGGGKRPTLTDAESVVSGQLGVSAEEMAEV